VPYSRIFCTQFFCIECRMFLCAVCIVCYRILSYVIHLAIGDTYRPHVNVNDHTTPVADSRGAVGATAPCCLTFFFKKPLFRVYFSLCAFAINEDGADKLSFAAPPFQNFWICHCTTSHEHVFVTCTNLK